MLPRLAQGHANTLWVVPSELTEALKGIGQAFARGGDAGAEPPRPGRDAGRAE